MRKVYWYSGSIVLVLLTASIGYIIWETRIPKRMPNAVLDVLVTEIYKSGTPPSDGAIYVFNQGGTFFVDVVSAGPQGRSDAFFQIEGSKVTKLDHWFPSGHAEIFPNGVPARLCFEKRFKQK